MSQNLIYAIGFGHRGGDAVSASRRSKTFGVHTRDDFLVAGRKLPWTVLVFTLLSSWIGAGSLFGGAEKAYSEGFIALWQPAADGAGWS